MNFVWAFLVGGLICVVGQLLIDLHQAYPRAHSGAVRCGGRGAQRAGLVRSAG